MKSRTPKAEQVNIGFSRPEDKRLLQFIKQRAYECRYSIPTFVVVALHEAFKEKMEEYEVERMAAEAAQKVRERAVTPEPPPPGAPIMAAPNPSPISMEQAARDAEAEIAKLDAMAATMMAKRKLRSIKVPPMPTK